MQTEERPKYKLKEFFQAWMGDTIEDPSRAENKSLWVSSVRKMATDHPLNDVVDVYQQLEALIEKLKACGDNTRNLDEIITSVGAWWAIGDRSANAYIAHYTEVCSILKSTLEQRGEHVL